MSTPTPGQEAETAAVAAPVPDPAWLRAKRKAIHTEADLREFDEELGRLVDDLQARPGTGVGLALAWTAGGILVAVLVMLAGWGLLELGSSMWGWLNEQ